MGQPQTTSAPTLLDHLFEKMAVGLCLVAPDGTIVRANAEWLRSTGFTAEQVIGEDVVELFPGVRDMAIAMHARARAGYRVDVPRHAQIVNGRETWWEGSIEPVPMDGGTGLLITATEVAGAAARAQHREFERHHRELSELSPDPIIVNAAGRIAFANRAAVELFRAGSADGLVGKTPFELFHPEFHDEIRARIAKLRAGGHHADRVRQRIVRLDGTTCDVEVIATPFDDGEGRAIEVVLRDISDQRRAERQRTIIAGIARIFENALTSESEEELGRACLAIAEEVTGSKFGFIAEVNPRTGRLDDIAISDPGWDACRMPEKTGHGTRNLPVEFEMHGIYGRVLLDGKSVVTNEPRSHPDSIGAPPGHPPLRAFLGVPLVHARTTWGMMALANREGGYGPDELEAAEALAPAIVQAFTSKRVAEELRRANEKLQATFDSSTDGIAVLDRDWRYTYVSETGARMLGVRREDMIGRCLWDLFPDAARTQFGEQFRGAVETQQPAHFEEFYPAPLEMWLECHCYPSQEGLSVYFRDVTQRKHADEALRQALERLHIATEAAQLGIHDHDVAAGTIRWDDRVRELWGVAADEPITYETFLAGVHPEDREATQAALERALSATGGGQYSAEYRVRSRSDGRERWVAATGTVTSVGGRGVRLVGTLQDITSRRRAEQALKDANDQLRAANEKLRDADRRKDEFIGMLSHELRNPLAPIRNSTYILRHAEPGTEQARRAQLVVERQTAHLTRLVDDLLDVTRIARGHIELRRSRVDLREIVSRAAEDFRVLLRDHAVGFEVVIPGGKLWADADATRVTQIVGNLLHNSAKFTQRGDEVTLSLERVGGHAEIRVRDTGDGIDGALLPHVFDAFVQGEPTLARTDGGLGLGLALVKGIAELHGGTVAATSAGRGCGSEILVRLPLAEPADADAAAEPVTQERKPTRRVLVVDDNADAAESLADLVRMLGHAVEVAYDGSSAVEKARSSAPHVVICDLGLPGMSGYEVARELRATGADGMQLIALSGYAQPEDVQRAIEAGFDTHVAKPCDPAKIEQLLR